MVSVGRMVVFVSSSTSSTVTPSIASPDSASKTIPYTSTTLSCSNELFNNSAGFPCSKRSPVMIPRTLPMKIRDEARVRRPVLSSIRRSSSPWVVEATISVSFTTSSSSSSSPCSFFRTRALSASRRSFMSIASPRNRTGARKDNSPVYPRTKTYPFKRTLSCNPMKTSTMRAIIEKIPPVTSGLKEGIASSFALGPTVVPFC